MTTIRVSATRIWSYILLLLLAIITQTYGGCEFPPQWSGKWFQSGVGILQVNRTSIVKKGECYDSQGDKFLIYDRSDDCYRCMVIHEKHLSVLQYKETYCDQKSSLAEVCNTITGDAALYSMFRKTPDPKPVQCPFKSAPFTFTYNRGSGECSNPPSRAESCTDDSRLVLKYQACPDIQSTESNVEELVCVATWKEGSTRYLVGKLNQVQRGRSASDEDQYRCFVYERVAGGGANSNKVTFHIAQSGDATCIGLSNAFEGSRTIRLTTADSHHGRCRFPAWITDHHTWFSLDHLRTYKFSLRNATLRITTTQPQPDEHHIQQTQAQDHHGAEDEVRVVCHSILQAVEQRHVQIVAHMTAGCNSGYVCMVFHKRDATVIEIQQSQTLYDNTDDACRYFDPKTSPYTTLIAPALHPNRCPHPGRYSLLNPPNSDSGAGGNQGSKKRRQVPDLGPGPGLDTGSDGVIITPPECLSHDYEALAVGCSTTGAEIMEFKSPCPHQPISAYTCHGSWQENNTHYLIASPVARKSTDALRYCLVYTFEGDGLPNGVPGAGVGGGQGGAGAGYSHHRSGQMSSPPPPSSSVTMMRLSGLSDTCHRQITPGASGLWAFNFTTNGACSQSSETGAANSFSSSPTLAISLLLLISLLTTSYR